MMYTSCNVKSPPWFFLKPKSKNLQTKNSYKPYYICKADFFKVSINNWLTVQSDYNNKQAFINDDEAISRLSCRSITIAGQGFFILVINIWCCCRYCHWCIFYLHEYLQQVLNFFQQRVTQFLIANVCWVKIVIHVCVTD